MRKKAFTWIVGLLVIGFPSDLPHVRTLASQPNGVPSRSLDRLGYPPVRSVEVFPPQTIRRAESRASLRRQGASRSRRSLAPRHRARARQRRARRAALRRLIRLDARLKRATQEAIRRDELRGEDPDIREAALEALRGHAGTVVVMDPHSGRIYSIVNQEWAVRRGFKPCSTIKLLVALAGLREGIIDAKTPLLLNRGSVAMNLIDALAYSNNHYFEIVGERLGREKLLDYAREWGFGQLTGINLPRESAGKLPAPARALRTRRSTRGLQRAFSSLGYPAKGPSVGRMASHGDGFAVTALQLAVFTSALINGGKLLRPYILVDRLGDSEETPLVRRHVELLPEYRESIISGMIATVEYGTAKLAYVPQISFAGKTGSCRSDSLWLGLFVSFAPVQDPRLVVVVITHGLNERGSTAAQIAGRIYQRLAHRSGILKGILVSPRLTEDTPADLVPVRASGALPDGISQATGGGVL